MAKFKEGDVVVVTEEFDGNAREFVGRTGIIVKNSLLSFERVIALNGDEDDLLAVNEREIAHV